MRSEAKRWVGRKTVSKCRPQLVREREKTKIMMYKTRHHGLAFLE